MAPGIALRIAIFAQAPDEIGEIDAKEVIPPHTKFTSPHLSRPANESQAERETREAAEQRAEIVQAGGHALTGRPSEEERAKRAEILLGLTPGTPEYGAAVHAFGDSFAHAEPISRDMRDIPNANLPPNLGPQHQYGGEEDFPLGHLKDLTAPDAISWRPSLYARYATNLYHIFQSQAWDPAKGSSPQDVAALLEKVGKAAGEEEQIKILKNFIQEHGGNLDYKPEAISVAPLQQALTTSGNPPEFKEINISRLYSYMAKWEQWRAPVATVEQVIASHRPAK
jgi:hypothetical protein